MIISVIFSAEVMEEYNLENNLQRIQKIISSVYNVFEPEYSKYYPMVVITVTIPQIFKTSKIPKNINFDSFFYDSSVISKENVEESLIEQSESQEKIIFKVIFLIK